MLFGEVWLKDVERILFQSKLIRRIELATLAAWLYENWVIALCISLAVFVSLIVWRGKRKANVSPRVQQDAEQHSAPEDAIAEYIAYRQETALAKFGSLPGGEQAKIWESAFALLRPGQEWNSEQNKYLAQVVLERYPNLCATYEGWLRGSSGASPAATA